MCSSDLAMVGDLLQPPPRLSPGMFDHAMVNPPFIEEGRGTPSVNPAKALATIEGGANLGDWVRFALAMVRGKGSVSFVHRADRIDSLLAHLPIPLRRGRAVRALLPAGRRKAGAGRGKATLLARVEPKAHLWPIARPHRICNRA